MCSSLSGTCFRSTCTRCIESRDGDGAAFGDIATDLYWVAGYTAGAVALAVVAFKRRMIE